MENLMIDLQKKVVDGFKEKDKAQQEKFMVSISLADSKTYDLLLKSGINITKCSQFKVLTLDPKVVARELELGDKMGFLSAYKEDPTRLCQMDTNVIKRMAKCDALGITYKDESGNFEKYIFSEREFNKEMASHDLSTENVALNDNNTEESELSSDNVTDINELKEYALRILEVFGMMDEKDNVMNRLLEVSNNGFSNKESLMEVFKVYGGNSQLLSDTIDDILGLDEEVSLGRAA
ncbi:MAG: hypothetical protein RR478_05240 [Bacilli bacterium]